jgi:hypothetical protein
MVKGLADVAVQETFAAKSTQPVDLPVTIYADPASPDHLSGENLAELPCLEDRNAGVSEDRRFGPSAVQEQQRLMRQ